MMAANWEISDFRRMIDDEDCHPYWSPTSQGFTSAEVLLTYIGDGWKLDHLVMLETYFLGGHRRSDIYHFTLSYLNKTINVPVLANPVVHRIIGDYQLIVREKERSGLLLGFLLKDGEPSH